MVKINYKLLPVKGHYFFFMAAMGPLLPFFPLIGRQVGVSKMALGLVSAVFPLLYLIIKPLYGYLADSLPAFRKALFLGVVIATCLSFDLLSLVQRAATMPCHSLQPCATNYSLETECRLECGENGTWWLGRQGEELCHVDPSPCLPLHTRCALQCHAHLHSSLTFWAFALLASVGNICFNISNFISDAICFDILGPGNDTKYGLQRVWGTLGFGVTALLGCFLVSNYSSSVAGNDYSPAFLLATACMVADLFFCYKLKLPTFTKNENIFRDVSQVIKQPRVSLFLVFATLVGVLDSSTIYFLLWYLEDLAVAAGTQNVILLQGLIVAAETLIGETVSFFLSERLLNTLGYVHCLSVGLLCYAVRLCAVAAAKNPWHVLPVEAVMQGPTYALLYTTIVAYASAVTPPGTSATVQGLVAGMDDGLGYSMGCLIGGFVYHHYGGSVMYFSYGLLALACSITHFSINKMFFSEAQAPRPDVLSCAYEPAKTDVELKVLKNGSSEKD